MDTFYNLINYPDYEIKTDQEIKINIFGFIKNNWMNTKKRDLFIHMLESQNISNSDNKYILRIFDQVTESISNHFLNNTSLSGFNLERM